LIILIFSIILSQSKLKPRFEFIPFGGTTQGASTLKVTKASSLKRDGVFVFKIADKKLDGCLTWSNLNLLEISTDQISQNFKNGFLSWI